MCERNLTIWSHFRMFDYKEVIKVTEWKQKRFCYIETMHCFDGWQETLVKTWNKAFHCTTVLFHITFESKCETNDKSCLALGQGKSIFACVIFKMYTQLHTQTNHEIWDNFLSWHMHRPYRRAWHKFALSSL